jgi:hypothetical protein
MSLKLVTAAIAIARAINGYTASETLKFLSARRTRMGKETLTRQFNRRDATTAEKKMGTHMNANFAKLNSAGYLSRQESLR